METRNNATRFINYDRWESTKYMPYNYVKNGLLNRIMSSQIANTNNAIFKVLLQFVESSLFFVMKYTDILKNFKNIHWKNR